MGTMRYWRSLALTRCGWTRTPTTKAKFSILGRDQDGKLFWVEWSYGSCSGCDEWEARELSSEQIQAELRKATAFFDSVGQARAFFAVRPDNSQQLAALEAVAP